ncbi:MAG: hypothetical protein IPM46_02720 [Flavobacteriales bacterium]|nr:hypothetical protein [Flavobacteriales bacterium]
MANKSTPKPSSPRKAGKAKPRPAAARMPGEQHPGQPTSASKHHDRAGSQLERERHLRPGSAVPKAGAGRTNKKAVARKRGGK